ncbi:MAG: hypothetical protein HQL16_07445, partial [Candidatus Omnitrophica bacterium]|nr:hypothetical protein [Candidatus Omnitrophota bacterium]
QFLEYFGLRSLEDLPKLEEFPALMVKENEVRATSVAEAPAAVPEVQLNEELAKARTKLDIDQLERDTAMMSEFMEPTNIGESSGQSRVLGAENDAVRPEGESSPDTDAKI